MKHCRGLGIALDIDGVLLRGSKIIPRARDAMKLIHDHEIPHVFMTNGGGCSEEEKAATLSTKLHVPVNPDQVILAHTPYKRLEEYKKANVYVIGSSQKAIDAFKAYGFQSIVTSEDILRFCPSIHPRNAQTIKHHGGQSKDNGDKVSSSQTDDLNSRFSDIKAAFIVHDPHDWSVDMQLLTDILLDGRPHPHPAISTHSLDSAIKHNGSNQIIPLYSCNSDLVYTTEYHRPRYTQGAFIDAFQHIFERFTKSKLVIEKFGKPFSPQYQMAEELIQQRSSHRVTRFCGIGDNPASDIRGANAAGSHWTSVLVKTGIFKGEDNDDIDRADIVMEDIYEAVQYIIRNYQ